MTLSPEDVNYILENPTEVTELANLTYIAEEKLSIQRKKVGRGFSYFKNGEKITDTKILERIKSLVIPPAWTNVRISSIKKGHLQAIGRDEKDRKQYLYHPLWSKLRNQTKFFRLASFGKTLPRIRKQVEKDLELPQMTRRKVLALVIRLMEETHIRIGNAYYARENKTYGLSTLRAKHLKTDKNKIKFEFIGKKGKEQSVTIRNKKLIKLVNQCEEIPGWELFKFYDENGNKTPIDSGMINEYIQEISGGDKFSAKDFRTWSASKIFFETLYELGYEEDEKRNKKNILTAYDTAAQGLGNTRAVCREYYVHPTIVKSYESGEIEEHFKKVRTRKEKNYQTLSGTEKVMLQLIGDFEIDI